MVLFGIVALCRVALRDEDELEKLRQKKKGSKKEKLEKKITKMKRKFKYGMSQDEEEPEVYTPLPVSRSYSQ